MITTNRKDKAWIIVLVGIIAGLLYPILSKEIEDVYALINGLIIGLTGSTFIVIVELYITGQRHRKKAFIPRVLIKSTLYTGFFALLVLLTLSLSRSIKYNIPYPEYLTSDAFYSLVFLEDFPLIILYVLFCSSLIIFTNQISRKMGQGVLWNFITGKYHNPKIENRIFMFLDIKSSTTIAEKLGNVKFSNLINDILFDITPAIINTSGIIYRYVGDQVAVTWKTNPKHLEAGCISTFFLVKQVIDKGKEKYREQYGFVPEFTAGFHCGPVVIGELGEVKSQITFSGDVLYLTNKLQSRCKYEGVENLISEVLLRQIVLPPIYETRPVSMVEDRSGRKMNIYSVTELN